MQQYAEETLQGLTSLLEKGIQEGYEPLQSYSLSLIGTIAQVIEEEFGQFFETFIKAFATIIDSCGDTHESKKLSAKAIETVGDIISAVSKGEDSEQFKPFVTELT